MDEAVLLDAAGDTGSAISTSPGATRTRLAPIVSIRPCFPKLTRTRSA
jgi:hypothetical protein